jgi:hypothetical protein
MPLVEPNRRAGSRRRLVERCSDLLVPQQLSRLVQIFGAEGIVGDVHHTPAQCGQGPQTPEVGAPVTPTNDRCIALAIVALGLNTSAATWASPLMV